MTPKLPIRGVGCFPLWWAGDGLAHYMSSPATWPATPSQNAAGSAITKTSS